MTAAASPGAPTHGTPAAPLDPEEERKAHREESASAGVTHEAIRLEGVKELERAPSALAWSSFAGGLSLALSLLMSALIQEALPEASWRHLVVSMGYPVGFLVVILGSQQLYTENTLTPMVPLMSERTGEMLRKVLTLWGIVLVGNLLGTWAVAVAMADTAWLTPELQRAATAVAIESTDGSASTLFVRAIAAGWIIALLVWMLPGGSTERVVVIILMAWLVGALKLPHIGVGAVACFYLAASDVRTYADVLLRFIGPSLVGNTIGGVLLVAAVNHAQVAAGKRGEKR